MTSPPAKTEKARGRRTRGDSLDRSSRRAFLRILGVTAPLGLVGASLLPLASKTAPTKAAEALTTADALRRSYLKEALGERSTADAGLDPNQGLALRVPTPPSPLAPGSAASTTYPPIPDESELVRMQRELKRAMEKPITERKWLMVIDLRKCIGCSACTVACKAENHLPPGVVYRPVIEEEIGEYPNVTRRFVPRPCMQCDDPPCTRVCPVGATWKREDGIVVIDYNKCIGCRYCIAACPYGARYFDFGENYTDGTPVREAYEQSPSPEYGKSWPRDGSSSPIGNVRKCQFCIHRLNAGMLPACVTTCVGAATYFGDKNDPEGLVNQLLATGRAVRLKEELGTDPKVYYLV